MLKLKQNLTLSKSQYRANIKLRQRQPVRMALSFGVNENNIYSYCAENVSIWRIQFYRALLY